MPDILVTMLFLLILPLRGDTSHFLNRGRAQISSNYVKSGLNFTTAHLATATSTSHQKKPHTSETGLFRAKHYGNLLVRHKILHNLDP